MFSSRMLTLIGSSSAHMRSLFWILLCPGAAVNPEFYTLNLQIIAITSHTRTARHLPILTSLNPAPTRLYSGFG